MPLSNRITDSINLNKKENNIVLTPVVRSIAKYSSIKNDINVEIAPSDKKTINKKL